MLNKRIILMIMAIMAWITIAVLWPPSELRTADMQLYVSDNFAVYFEPHDEQAAIDIIKKLEDRLPEIHSMLQFEKNSQTEVYLYHDQSLFQSRKYGRMGSWLAPDWYVGDNIKDKVIMVSPSAPDLLHSYEEMLQVAVHEYVHTVNERINSGMPKWLDEGLALYLSGQYTDMVLPEHPLPTINDLNTKNPLTFAKIGGYQIAGSYIAYINSIFGDQILADLIRNPDNFREILGYSEDELYHLWASHVMEVLYVAEERIL